MVRRTISPAPRSRLKVLYPAELRSLADSLSQKLGHPKTGIAENAATSMACNQNLRGDGARNAIAGALHQCDQGTFRSKRKLSE